MDKKTAFIVLDNNYECKESSFIYDLYENDFFSNQHFWDCYDSIMALAKEALANGRDIDTAMKITFVYQRILKEIICHFDEMDCSRKEDFPDNYVEYLERLDGAIDAYFRGIFMEEGLYSLER